MLDFTYHKLFHLLLFTAELNATELTATAELIIQLVVDISNAEVAYSTYQFLTHGITLRSHFRSVASQLGGLLVQDLMLGRRRRSRVVAIDLKGESK